MKFLHADKFIRKEKTIHTGYNLHTVKEPSLKEWIEIYALDFSDTKKSYETLCKIMLPTLEKKEFTEMTMFQKQMVIYEIIETLKGDKEESSDSNEKVVKKEPDVEIELGFLILKYMKHTGSSINETLSMNVFTFFYLFNTLDSVIAEDVLRNSEVGDNHLKLKKGDIEGYKEVLNRYNKALKKSVFIKQETDFEGLKALSLMLGGN